MKYRNAGPTMGHKLYIRKRETAFEKKVVYSNESSLGSEIEAHRTMNIHEYATFQKEQFKKRKEENKKRRGLIVLTIIIVLILVFGIPYFLNNYDFDLLTSTEFL